MLKLLQWLPPEMAHNLGKWAMKRQLCATSGHTTCMSNGCSYRLFDFPIRNRLGLAAGFDKNGELVEEAMEYGFGYTEVGSVTLRGGPGNKKPRMFRIGDFDIMNRMGLNGDPAPVVAERLKKAPKHAMYGVNVAKTHSPDIMGDAAITDIINCYHLVKNLGFYTVLNVSCPNTKEGKTFESPGALRELLAAVEECGKGNALAIKFSPLKDLSHREITKFQENVDACVKSGIIDGYIVCNTKPIDHERFGKGGRSGVELQRITDFMVTHLSEQLASGEEIIAVGGIFDGYTMHRYLSKGATACQAYNGFVRGPHAGPDFAHKVLDECALMERQK